MCLREFCEYPESGLMTASPPVRVGVGPQQIPTCRGSQAERLLAGRAQGGGGILPPLDPAR